MTTRSAIVLTVALLLLAPEAARAAQGDCGQPVSTGTGAVASDCLFMLNVSVGIGACDPTCICELNETPPVTATDALLCLNVAVAIIAQPACPCTATTSTTSTTTTSTTTTTLASGPLACGDAEAPSCDGTCGPNEACLVGVDGCQCEQFGCGLVETAPQCSGLCPPGNICTISGEGCQCVPSAINCETADAPSCDGDCGDASYCSFDAESGHCLCTATTCGEFAGAPTCLGICPEGLSCEPVEGFCGCVE